MALTRSIRRDGAGARAAGPRISCISVAGQSIYFSPAMYGSGKSRYASRIYATIGFERLGELMKQDT